MEVGGVVRFSSGSMEALMRKLASFPEGTADTKQKAGLGAAIKSLKDELGSIQTNMGTFAPAGEPTVQGKQWMKQVRETAYDIEDWADEHLHRAVDREGAERHVGAVMGLLKKVKKLQGTKDELPNSQIHEFKKLVEDANERFKRYELKKAHTPPPEFFAAFAGTGESDDTPAPARALHAEETGLVGIDGPLSIILKKLDDHKVVFLAGSGGLGKTTLATQLWRRPSLRRKFDVAALVEAGRTTSVKALLMRILGEVNGKGPGGYESCTEQQLINKLKESLDHKKYLIVIDGLWNAITWQVIKCALPEENEESRVIITTRMKEVASSLCVDENSVYKMKPLDSIEHEKSLFFGRIFGEYPTEFARDILKSCGGVPLAIIVMAGLLASNKGLKGVNESHWKSVHESIGGHNQEEVDVVIKKVLSLSYTNLPDHLKACFLYLSVFPEGHKIRKDRVVRRWVAEGFIDKGDKGSSQENGESCFSDLVSRGLIQSLPVEDDGERRYIVHDLVRQLIISTSAEENFVTLSSQLINDVPHDKIRRLSLQCNNQEVTPTMKGIENILSNVRSLTVFGRNEEKEDLGKFRCLRLLDLEDAHDVKKEQVQKIDQRLFQLKYLGLGPLKGDKITDLLEQFGALQKLETLDMRQTGLQKLDVDGDGFSKLVHLLATDVELPSGINKMKELQELSMVQVSDSSTVQSLQKLGELEKLRILGVKWGLKKSDKDRGDKFIEALDRLGNHSLQSLCIDVGAGSSAEFLVDSWCPSLRLGEFRLARSHYYFPRLPSKMATAKLPHLTHLEIGLDKVSVEDLRTLGGLPALILLRLRSREAGSLAVGSAGFSRLEVFWFERGDGTLDGLTFTKGAMPKLWKLRLRCSVRGATALAKAPVLGLGNLVGLKHVHVKMDCKDADHADAVAAEAAITEAAKGTPKCRLEITE